MTMGPGWNGAFLKDIVVYIGTTGHENTRIDTDYTFRISMSAVCFRGYSPGQ